MFCFLALAVLAVGSSASPVDLSAQIQGLIASLPSYVDAGTAAQLQQLGVGVQNLLNTLASNPNISPDVLGALNGHISDAGSVIAELENILNNPCAAGTFVLGSNPAAPATSAVVMGNLVATASKLFGDLSIIFGLNPLEVPVLPSLSALVGQLLPIVQAELVNFNAFLSGNAANIDPSTLAQSSTFLAVQYVNAAKAGILASAVCQ